MDNTIERENLESLIHSDGWRTFADYVNGEWGQGGREFVAAVTAAADNTDDASATAHLRQIVVAQKIIQRLMKWPEERLKQIHEPQLQAIYPRRGRL